MLFDFLLQQAKAKALETDTGKCIILKQDKTILTKAVDAQHSHSKTGTWNMSSKSNGIKLFGELLCWCEKKDCGLSAAPTTSFHNAYENRPTTFHLLYTHPYIKNLHKLDEAPPDVTPAFFTSEICPTASTTTSTGTNSGAESDYCIPSALLHLLV